MLIQLCRSIVGTAGEIVRMPKEHLCLPREHQILAHERMTRLAPFISMHIDIQPISRISECPIGRTCQQWPSHAPLSKERSSTAAQRATWPQISSYTITRGRSSR